MNYNRLRHKLDFYETPPWMCLLIIKYIQLTGTIGEICSGHGAMSSILEMAGYEVWTNDIDVEKPADFHIDATKPLLWTGLPACDWIVTNPPYGKLAAPIVQNALNHARKGIAMLLPENFQQGCEDRLEFFREHPPTAIYDLPRYCFRRGGDGKWSTDSKPIKIFVWKKSINHGFTKMYWFAHNEIALFNRNPDTIPELDRIKAAVSLWKLNPDREKVRHNYEIKI